MLAWNEIAFIKDSLWLTDVQSKLVKTIFTAMTFTVDETDLVYSGWQRKWNDKSLISDRVQSLVQELVSSNIGMA